MRVHITIDEILRMTERLTHREKLKVITGVLSQLEPPLSAQVLVHALVNLDDQYQRGYEQLPENAADLESLLPHLPIVKEQW